jgi:hypothetical protein
MVYSVTHGRSRKGLMGRKPLGREAMTATQRQRRRRERLKQGQTLLALCRAWEACTKAERTRFLRGLRAEQLAAKQARRAARVMALAEKVRLANEERGKMLHGPDYVEPQFHAAGQIVGWIGRFPIISGGLARFRGGPSGRTWG